VAVLLEEMADGRAGLDMLVPDDEFDRLADAVADRTFDAYDVFRTTEGASCSCWTCSRTPRRRSPCSSPPTTT
jgi:hypothetical protein